MQSSKLDRERPNKINAHQADQLYLWDSPFEPERQNLTLRDHAGRDVLTVFSITHDQLADLYVDIGRVLGKSPDTTIHHLKQIRDIIGTLIDSGKTEPQQEPDCVDPFSIQ